MVYPVKGVGELGMNTVIASPEADRIDRMPSPVTRPIDQRPLRGYSIATTRLNLIGFSSEMRKSTTCFTWG